MSGKTQLIRTLTLITWTLSVALAQGQEPDRAQYEKRFHDPVLKEMRANNDAAQAAAQARTEEILAGLEAAVEEAQEQEQRLRFDLSDIARPQGPDDFATKNWHFPPTPQFLTGTCWSFCATSFLESEVKRITGQEIKLSEMWIVYWEYVAKAKGFVENRGESAFASGSEATAAIRMIAEHGIVPRSAYPGVLAEHGRFDHSQLHTSMEEFLLWCQEQDYWDSDVIIGAIRQMLDATMGPPPKTVRWDGVDYPPQRFLARVCQLEPGAYVDLMSTLSEPFWQRGEFKVPDNWWHHDEYVNLPLAEWYDLVIQAIDSGFTLTLAGDNSEPGYNGHEDIAVIPSFDIPGSRINQDSREFRFANGTTTDDHCMHLVGHTKLDGREWFLIKDSNRSSRQGSYEGYFMFRDDYLRLKMLAITVHRDMVKDILKRVDGEN